TLRGVRAASVLDVVLRDLLQLAAVEVANVLHHGVAGGARLAHLLSRFPVAVVRHELERARQQVSTVPVFARGSIFGAFLGQLDRGALYPHALVGEGADGLVQHRLVGPVVTRAVADLLQLAVLDLHLPRTAHILAGKERGVIDPRDVVVVVPVLVVVRRAGGAWRDAQR